MKNQSNVTPKERIKATVIDLVIMLLITVIIGVPIVACAFYFVCELIGVEINSKLIEIVTMFLGWFIYPVFMELLTPYGSLGKKISKIKVIDAETGEKPSKKKLILRGLIFSFLTIFDAFFCIVNIDHLSVIDMITKTRVVPETYGEKEFFDESI